MRVLVLNPVSKVTKNIIRDVLYGCWCKGKRIGGGSVPPFALLEVATILKQDGNEVCFLDAQAEQWTYPAVVSKAANYDAVIISTSTMSITEDASMLSEIKAGNPKIKTIVFGSHPTFMPQYTLAHQGVDVAVRHEPEMITRDLIRLLRAGEDWTKLDGIAFRLNGQPQVNKEYTFVKNLDELPFPDVTMLPKHVDYYNPLVRRMPYMTLATSKGCPAKCTFCTAPYFDGNIVRFQSADYIVREIEYLLSHGFREVYFRDDTFFVHKKRDHEMCRQIIEKKLDVSWIANARVCQIDKPTMEIAKQAGCHTLKFGVESGDQQVLDRIKKDYELDQAREVFQWAKEVGLNTHAHCMLGMPGDNSETLQKTIDFVKELDPTTATFGICTPYPGTPLFDEVAQLFPEIRDGSQSDLKKLHVAGLFNEHFTTLTRTELEESVPRAYREFYMRPSYWSQVVRGIRGIDDVKRISIAASNVFQFSMFGE